MPFFLYHFEGSISCVVDNSYPLLRPSGENRRNEVSFLFVFFIDDEEEKGRKKSPSLQSVTEEGNDRGDRGGGRKRRGGRWLWRVYVILSVRAGPD